MYQKRKEWPTEREKRPTKKINGPLSEKKKALKKRSADLNRDCEAKECFRLGKSQIVPWYEEVSTNPNFSYLSLLQITAKEGHTSNISSMGKYDVSSASNVINFILLNADKDSRTNPFEKWGDDVSLGIKGRKASKTQHSRKVQDSHRQLESCKNAICSLAPTHDKHASHTRSKRAVYGHANK